MFDVSTGYDGFDGGKRAVVLFIGEPLCSYSIPGLTCKSQDSLAASYPSDAHKIDPFLHFIRTIAAIPAILVWKSRRAVPLCQLSRPTLQPSTTVKADMHRPHHRSRCSQDGRAMERSGTSAIIHQPGDLVLNSVTTTLVTPSSLSLFSFLFRYHLLPHPHAMPRNESTTAPAAALPGFDRPRLEGATAALLNQQKRDSTLLLGPDECSCSSQDRRRVARARQPTASSRSSRAPHALVRTLEAHPRAGLRSGSEL
ncbi:hypothetical protein R3P38DRAFT_3561129 [Favolaschia claudopus]|uniref:Uncharacterized protein n=1 Tax=Favolaschia claudopus TaxID=2862362 RepID=A0AAW0AVX4_9AGAR